MDSFFYLGIDGLIFLLALPGIWLEWKVRRFIPIWIITSMLTLLFWPTKWPQYSLVVLPAFCMAAATAVKVGYEKLREQELYWEWFHNMFPRPSRRYIIIIASLLGLLLVGALVSQALIAINRIGWSSIAANTSGLPNNAVNDIQALPDGRMLIGTDDGVAFWKAASGDEVVDEWQVFNPGNSSLPDQHVLSVAQDLLGRYWFGTASGLASYDGTSWTLYRGSDFGLSSEQINTLATDDQNRIWIGTQDGVAVFDDTGWKAFTKESSGLVDNAVFSIAVQQIGGNPVIWFGTLSGVSSLEPTTGHWQAYTRSEIDLGWGGVSDLYFDSIGKLWVCTEGGGISLWDGNAWTTIRVNNSRLPYSTIETVVELKPGVFWIAASIPNTSGGVLARYDGTNWRIFEQGLSGYSGAETVTIAKDDEGRYWFGTRTEGIDIFVPRQ
jgi:ligand-binding sensor domain-containing protein